MRETWGLSARVTWRAPCVGRVGGEAARRGFFVGRSSFISPRPGCCAQADGYAEAIVRGFRSAFITEDEYHHLTQCETIEGAWVWSWTGVQQWGKEANTVVGCPEFGETQEAAFPPPLCSVSPRQSTRNLGLAAPFPRAYCL